MQLVSRFVGVHRCPAPFHRPRPRNSQLCSARYAGLLLIKFWRFTIKKLILRQYIASLLCTRSPEHFTITTELETLFRWTSSCSQSVSLVPYSKPRKSSRMEKDSIISKSLLSCLDNRIRLARHTNCLPAGLQPLQAGKSSPSSKYPLLCLQSCISK